MRLFFEAVGLDMSVASKLFVFPEWMNGSSKKGFMAENEQDGHLEEQMSVKALSEFADEVLIDAYIRAHDAEVQDGKRGSSLLNFIIVIMAEDAVLGLGIELSPMRHSNESRSVTLAQAVPELATRRRRRQSPSQSSETSRRLTWTPALHSPHCRRCHRPGPRNKMFKTFNVILNEERRDEREGEGHDGYIRSKKKVPTSIATRRFSCSQ